MGVILNVRVFRWLAFVMLGCCFSSCFQIVEDITVHEDGSGQVTLTANLSQSRTKLASVMLLDSVNGYKIPSQADIRSGLATLTKALSAISGISQVSHQVNFDTYVAVVKFSFDDVSNLNEVMNKAFSEMKIPVDGRNAYRYDRQQQLFSRQYSHVSQAKAEYDRLKPADQAVFKDAIYTSIYRFSRPVERVANPAAKVAASRRAVMLQTPVLALIDGSQSLSNRIQLSK